MKEVFKAERNGEMHEFAVLKPTPKQLEEAQLHFNLAFQNALKNKALLRAKVDVVLREQGVWDDDKQAALDKVREEIYRLELQLKAGGIRKSEARNIAIKIKHLREEVREFLSIRNSLDTLTAESQAENKRFDYLVSQCLVYNDTGKKYFNSLAEYEVSAGDEIASTGARKLGYMLYGLSEDFEKSLPENQFLLNYGFMNENMQLVNKDGKLIDESGKLIDADGRFVDADGNFVDMDGNRVDALGVPIVEFKPFLDDEEEVKTPKKKKVAN